MRRQACVEMRRQTCVEMRREAFVEAVVVAPLGVLGQSPKHLYIVNLPDDLASVFPRPYIALYIE